MKTLLISLALLAPLASAALGPAAPAPPMPPLGVLLDVAAGAGLPLRSPDLAALRPGTLREELLQHYALAGITLTGTGQASLDRGLAALPPAVQTPLAEVLAAMNVARLLHGRALADVTAAELAWARAATLVGEPPGAGEAVRLANLAARLELPWVAAAGALVTAAVQDAVPRLRAAAAGPGLAELAFVDPSGSVEVSGTGSATFTADRTLLLDLGGDDTWANNAAGAAPQAVIEAFPGCVATGALQCTPLDPARQDAVIAALAGHAGCSVALAEPVFGINRDLADAAAALPPDLAAPDPAAVLAFLLAAPPAWAAHLLQGLDPRTGCLPAEPAGLAPWLVDVWAKGVLTDGDAHFAVVGIDVAGDDTYAPPRTFNFMNDGRNPSGCDTRAQGEAGKLWDRNVTAGGAFASVAVLWDAAGADAYGGRSITQGAAHVGAFAALVDQGSAADRYEGVRMAQGMGLFAAVALLYDEGGDDRYALRNTVPLWNEFESFAGCDVSTRDGQGRANFDAVGALVDGGGDDAYEVQDHLAEGLFLPGAGRDDPTTTQGSTGFRLNVGPTFTNDLAALGRGFLWDRAGTDAYSRPGRGNACADTAGSFLDQGPSLPGSLAPCPAG